MGRGARAGVALLVVGLIGLAASFAAAAEGEGPVVVRTGEDTISFDFSVSPRSLPKGGGTAELKVAIGEESLGYSPGITAATIRLDRSIGFDLDGIPRCLYGVQIDAVGPSECDEAVVGKAEAKVIVQFPEGSIPIKVHSRGTIYKAGGTKLLVKLPFEWPINGELVFPVPIKGGATGDELKIKVPQITDGYGSLTSLGLDLERPYVTAECDRGKLRASADLFIGDGTEESLEATRACASG